MQIINNILKERFIKKSLKFLYRYRNLRYEDVYVLEDFVLTERYNSVKKYDDYNRYFIEIYRYNKFKLVCTIIIYDYYLEWL